MFQQPDNGESAQLRAGQRENHGPNQTTMQVMGMGWQQNGYGNVTMSFDMPTTSSYQYQPNWMATTSIPSTSSIQNPPSPDQPTSPNQVSSPTGTNYSSWSITNASNAALSISTSNFDQPGPSSRPSISNHEHQPLNDGLFKTPDSSVFAIKRERSHSTPNTANYQETNTSPRRTLNNSRLSRRIQPYARIGSNNLQTGATGDRTGEDLLRMEQERKQRNNERERLRVQIMNQAFDRMKEVMTEFPGPNPKTKLETWEAPVPIINLTKAIRDNLLLPEDIATIQNMDPKEPLEQQPSTSNE